MNDAAWQEAQLRQRDSVGSTKVTADVVSWNLAPPPSEPLSSRSTISASSPPHTSECEQG